MVERERALLLSGPQHADVERPLTQNIRRVLEHIDPLGIAIISTILKRYGFETHWMEMAKKKDDGSGLRLLMESVDAVFISSRFYDISLAQKAIKTANQIGIPVIVGGYGPTFSPEDFHNASSIVQGEVEPVGEQMVDDLLTGKLKPLYDSRELPPYDITNDYIRPDRTIFSQWRWPLSRIRKYPQEWQRGCSNFCTFCSPTRMQRINVTNGERLVRVRKTSDIKEEITHDMKLKRGDHLFSVDINSSAIPEEDLYDLFSFLKNSGIRWYTEGTVLPLLENLERMGKKDSLLSLMSATNSIGGCYSFLYGADDLISEKVAGSRDKNIKILDMAVETFRRFGIPLNLSVVVGLDNHHYPESFYEIARILEELKPPYSFIHIATPYPGTVWGEHVRVEGRVFNYKSTDYNHRKVVATPKNMSPEQLQQGYFWLLRQLNSPDKISKTTKVNFSGDVVKQNPTLASIQSGLIWAIETYMITLELSARGSLDWKFQAELDSGYR